jgi:hypothetical protein
MINVKIELKIDDSKFAVYIKNQKIILSDNSKENTFDISEMYPKLNDILNEIRIVLGVKNKDKDYKTYTKSMVINENLTLEINLFEVEFRSVVSGDLFFKITLSEMINLIYLLISYLNCQEYIQI